MECSSALPDYYIGYIYETQILFGSAFRHYAAAEKIDPTFIAPIQRYADILTGNGHVDKSLIRYNRILKINPRFADAYRGRGNAYDRKGEDSESKTLKNQFQQKAFLEYNKAIQFDPQNADAFYRRGNIYMQKSDFAKAVSDFTNAIKFNQKDFMTESYYESRAEAFCKAGKKTEAKADEQKVIELGERVETPCQ